MSKKLKEKKKKERERSSKAKVLERRERIRSLAKEKNEQYFREKEDSKLEPFMKEETRQERAKKALDYNIQMLKVLEEQYDKEQQGRINLNEELEAEGHTTIRQKLNALEIKAKKHMPTVTQGENGSLNFSFTPHVGSGIRPK